MELWHSVLRNLTSLKLAPSLHFGGALFGPFDENACNEALQVLKRRYIKLADEVCTVCREGNDEITPYPDWALDLDKRFLKLLSIQFLCSMCRSIRDCDVCLDAVSGSVVRKTEEADELLQHFSRVNGTADPLLFQETLAAAYALQLQLKAQRKLAFVGPTGRPLDLPSDFRPLFKKQYLGEKPAPALAKKAQARKEPPVRPSDVTTDLSGIEGLSVDQTKKRKKGNVKSHKLLETHLGSQETQPQGHETQPKHRETQPNSHETQPKSKRNGIAVAASASVAAPVTILSSMAGSDAGTSGSSAALKLNVQVNKQASDHLNDHSQKKKKKGPKVSQQEHPAPARPGESSEVHERSGEQSSQAESGRVARTEADAQQHAGPDDGHVVTNGSVVSKKDSKKKMQMKKHGKVQGDGGVASTPLGRNTSPLGRNTLRSVPSLRPTIHKKQRKTKLPKAILQTKQ